MILEVCCSVGTAATLYKEKWAPAEDEAEGTDLSQQTQAYIPGFVLKCYSEGYVEQKV